MTTENRLLEEKLDQVRDGLDGLNAVVAANLSAVREGLMGRTASVLTSVAEPARLARERCLLLVALQQPVARDLRLTMSALRIGHDYEHVQNLIQFLNDRVERLRATPIEPVTYNMAGILVKIVAVNTLVGKTWMRDLSDAKRMSIKPEVDEQCRSIYADISAIHAKTLDAIESGSGGADLLVELVLACRHLTRIVDLLKTIPDEAPSF